MISTAAAMTVYLDQCRQRNDQIIDYEKRINALECEKVALVKNLRVEIMKRNFLVHKSALPHSPNDKHMM